MYLERRVRPCSSCVGANEPYLPREGTLTMLMVFRGVMSPMNLERQLRRSTCASIGNLDLGQGVEVLMSPIYLTYTMLEVFRG